MLWLLPIIKPFQVYEKEETIKYLVYYFDKLQLCSPRGQALTSRRLDAKSYGQLASKVQALALRAALTIFASPSNSSKIIN